MRAAGHEPLAIIGMAVRLPGADDLDAYWSLLVEGRSAIGELPPDRLDRGLFFDPAQGVRGRTYSSIGGIVSPRSSPPRHWLLDPAQAADCDAAHLELCEIAAAAFRHAGIDPLAVPDRRAGVYVGHTRGTGLGGDLMYAAMLADTAAWLEGLEGFAEAAGGEPGRVIDAVVARERARLPRRRPDGGPRLDAQRCSSTVAQAFGLDGPCAALNAACSSSLFALASAADDLLLGRSDMALVAGSSHCRFDSLVLFSKAQSVSATGSRPFDATADGLVTAEGYVVVLVKTLRRALADGNPVHAVIRGIGVSSDGRGKSLWAPREEGQTEAIRRAHADLLDPARLGYVEAHATSTSVGDATEVRALARALREHVPAGRRIPIGSVKANIGHTLETAGLAGLVKAVLCLRHGTIPPVPGVETLNPDVDWEASPFVVPRTAMPWPRPADGTPRRAAVNSFGIGGLNAHVVLDEFTGVLPAPTAETAAPLDAAAFAPVAADDAVAIVGLAALAPGALSAGALWDLLGGDARPFVPVPAGRWNVEAAFDPGPAANGRTPQRLGGFIEGFAYDWRAHRIPPKQIAAADPLQFMLLDTVSKAIADAGHPGRELPRSRTGVVVGTVFGGDFAVTLQIGMRLPFFTAALREELVARGAAAAVVESLCGRFADLVVERLPALVDETGSFTSSSLASRITKTFDLMGGATAIDGGTASAVAALDVCRNFLLTGRVDCMICAAGQRSMSLSFYEQLALAGWLSRSGRPRAFDESSDGLLPAEGAAVFVLKRLSDARRDGDRIHAIIRGIGTARARDGRALTAAIDRALAGAGVPPESVAAVETAAAGVAALDRAELAALRAAYGERPALAALAPRIGFALGASAGLSLVKASCELEAVRLRDGISLAAAGRADVPEAALVPAADGRLFIGVDALHFDSAHHVLLERGTPVPVAAAPGRAAPHATAAAADAPSRIVRFAAPTVSELLALAEAAATDPATAFAREAGFAGAGHRLTIVAQTPADLAGKARLVTTQFENAEARGLWEARGIAVGEATGTRPLVACLFPGQGSQYPGMLRELVSTAPAAAAARDRIDAALEPLGYPTFDEIVADADGQLGRDVFRTQLAMLVADTIQFAVLTDLGLVPDRVTGHSYGEFAALHAAGAWDLATAARATFERCRAICEAPQVAGVMLSCAAGEEVVATACAAVGTGVFVSNCNSPQQTVVGGRREEVLELAGVLGGRGVTTKLLEVPRPFHTPLMREAEGPFRAALAGVRIGPPRIPLLSSVHNRYVAEPAEIRELLVEQLTRPVRYIDQIERLVAEGVGVFVESGPDRVLTRLTRRIIGERPPAVVPADMRSRVSRDAATAPCRLAALRAALEVTGALDRAPRPEKGDSHLFQGAGPAPTDGKEKGGCHLFPAPTDGEEKGGCHLFRATDERSGLIALAGTPHEMGRAHGRAFAGEIRAALALLADLPAAVSDRLLDPRAVLDDYDTMTTPEQREELRGIAAGAGVAYESLVAMHVRIDPSLEGGCVQAVFPAAVTRTGRLLQGANEDLPAGLVLRDSVRRCVQLRRPAGRLSSVTFTAVGVSAGINGMNEAGLVITSSMLLDQPPRTGPRTGLMHSALVDRVLSTTRTAADAVATIRAVPRDGAWAMLVSEGDGGRILHVEYDATQVREEEVREPVCLANHSLLGLGSAPVPGHSRARLERLEQLVTPSRCTATAEAFSMMLRDRFDVARQAEVRHATMNTIQRVDNQASVVFDPQARSVLCTVRRPDDGQIEFREIDCRDWFARPAVVSEPAPASATRPPAASPTAALPVIAVADYARLGTSVEGRSPVDPSDRICTRFLVRLVPWPLGAAVPRPLAGRALVVGSGPTAEAFARRLADLGVEPIRAANAADPACAAAIADSAADCSQLYLLDPLDDPALGAAPADWHAARERLLDRYALVQRWFARHEQAGSLATATVLAATSLGTAGGIADGVAAPVTGGITGLLKGLHTEERERRLQGFHAVVVDVPADATPEARADWLLAEARHPSENPEIVHVAGRRHAVRPVNVPLPPAPAPRSLAGAWVITGGARGVTAQVARGLGAVPGTVLHLVGSSPVPEVPDAWRNLDDEGLRRLREGVMREALARKELPADAWGRVERSIEIDTTLRGLAADGIRATYHACDVGDRSALAALLDRIRRDDGPLVGVIHGAGFEKASRFSRKKPELVDRTVRAKVDGAVNLMELTAGDPLTAFVVFGSISGRFGAVGQTDYCLANECVAKLVRWYRGRRPEVPAVVVAWHSWDEVGMAVRPESKFSKSLLKLRFMPPQEGVEHLLAEIAAGCPEAEVVITDWRYFKLRHPDPLWLPPAADTAAAATGTAAVPPTRAPSPSAGSASQPRGAPGDPAAPAAAIRRHVLRLVAAPRTAPIAGAPPGPVLVVGAGVAADAVVARLAALGVAADRLATDGSAADAVAGLDALLAAGQARSLLLTTAREDDAHDIRRPADWGARRAAGIVTPFLLVQRWFAHHAREKTPAALAAAVDLGGDFGISGGPRAPEGAAIAGLLKAVRIEAASRGWRSLAVAVVDAAPALPPAAVAARLVEEAAAADEVEVAFDALGRRHRVDVVAMAAPPATAPPPRAGAAWVAIGGARGITARMALHLARRFGVRMHLVGTAPPPDVPAAWRALDADGRARLRQEIAAAAVTAGVSPASRWLPVERALEIDATLQAFAAAGLPVTYHACDAADPAALATVLDAVRTADGPIEGVLQGAGAFERSRLEAKSAAQLERLLAAKLDATHALVTLTAQDPLRFVVLSGSIAGRFGTNGNADYALASDMQCGLAGWITSLRPEVHAVGFHWHPWDEAGMMMRSASFASREIMKLTLMPPAEGVLHLERELLAGTPEPQMVITDDGYRAWLAQTVRAAVRPEGAAAAPPPAPGQPSPPPVVGPPPRPLVDAIVEHEPGRRLVTECLLDPTAEPFLVQHRFRDRPLLPFVISLELLAEAAATLMPDRTVCGLDDVEIVSGLKFVHDRPLPVRVRLEADRDGIGAELVSDFVDRRGRVLTPDRLHVRGRVVFAGPAGAGCAPAPASAPARWSPIEYPAAREEIIYHGPIFRRLTGARLIDGVGWMRIDADAIEPLAGRRPALGWILSPAVLDACLFGCGLHVWLETPGVVAIPQAVRRLRFGRAPRPGEVCVERVRRVSRARDRAVFDFVLAGDDGSVILSADGFEAVVLAGIATS